jgi:hypothetical protein
MGLCAGNEGAEMKPKAKVEIEMARTTSRVIGRDVYGVEVAVSVKKNDVASAIASARKKGAVGRLDLFVRLHKEIGSNDL